MLVDDSASLLHGLRRGLTRARSGWCVRTATDPRSALEAVADEPADVVLADLEMPGLDGLSMIELMRRVSPATKFVMLSGRAGFDDVVAAINRAGVVRFLTKPCPLSQILEALEEALARRGDERTDLAPVAMAALDRLAPLIVVAADAKLLLATQPARPELGPDGHLSLDAAGRLRGRDPAETRVLHEAIAAAAATDADTGWHAPLVLEGGRDEPLRLIVTPMGRRPGGALLHLVGGAGPRTPSPETLSRLFGLTSSEAKVTSALASGLKVDEIAPELGLSPSSVRTYLKQAFVKTGATRQSDLVRLALSVATY